MVSKPFARTNYVSMLENSLLILSKIQYLPYFLDIYLKKYTKLYADRCALKCC